MVYFFLIGKQPVNRGLATHRLADHLAGGLTVHLEQRLMVDFACGHFQNIRIQPDRIDDAKLFRHGLWNVPRSHRIQHSMGDTSLHGAHQNVGVTAVGDGDFAHHQRCGFHLGIRVQDGEHLGVALHLAAHKRGHRCANRPIQLANDNLRLSTQIVQLPLHQGLGCAHANSPKLGNFLGGFWFLVLGHRILPLKRPRCLWSRASVNS